MYENFISTIHKAWGDIPIDEVKKDFSEEIESNRILFRIHTVSELLDVLEERDVINENNVQILKKLANCLQKNDCLNCIEEYEKNNSISNTCPQCGVPSCYFVPTSNLAQPLNVTVEDKNMDSETELKQCINYLVRKLGPGWVRLARTLNIDNAVIGNIQYTYDRCDVEEAIYQFFCRWQEMEGSKASLDILVTALRESRRVDLAEDLLKGKHRKLT